MMNYIVVVKVNGTEYLAKIGAESALAAEHYYLVQSVCSKHGYGVEAAMAFDVEMMKTETFRAMALAAEPISNVELTNIIAARNGKLLAMDEADEIIRKNRKLIAELTAQVEAAERLLKEEQ